MVSARLKILVKQLFHLLLLDTSAYRILRASGVIVLSISLIDWMMWTLQFDLNEAMVRIEKRWENLPARVVHFFTPLVVE